MVDKRQKGSCVRQALGSNLQCREKDQVKAIQDISFDIYEGETLGLVGESGSGKTTTGRAIIRLYDPTSGEILYNGKGHCQTEKWLQTDAGFPPSHANDFSGSLCVP